MQQKITNDPAKARYLRKQYADVGIDNDQQFEDDQFHKNLEKAVNQHSKHLTEKKLEDQINYFGNAIQPFHMKNEMQMGQIDDDGFFVFNKRGRKRDAWLESIQQAQDQEIADKIRKMINTNGRYQGIFDAKNQQLNQGLEDGKQSSEEEGQGEKGQSQESRNGVMQEKELSVEQQKGLSPNQIIELLVSLLPDSKSPNQYLKKLKLQKNAQSEELYTKIITLCNMYIEKTDDHEILTKKKEDLEEQIEQLEKKSQKSEEVNWDDQQDSQKAQH